MVLQKCLLKIRDPTRSTNIKALIYILDVLQSMVLDTETDNKREIAYLEFQAAFDIFLSFSKHGRFATARHDRTLKTNFKDLLLNPDYGLCVYIVGMAGKRYICLRPDNANLGSFFDLLVRNDAFREEKIDVDELKQLLSSMDSEWDKKVVRYILSTVRCYSEIQSLGFDTHNVKSLREDVRSFLSQMAAVDTEAQLNVKNNLKRAYDACTEKCTKKKRLLNSKRHLWTAEQVEEKEEEVKELEECADSYQKVIQGNNEASYHRRVIYEKKKLVTSKRLKARRLGQGRKRMVDEEGERYVAKCVEEKATAHGRRHTSVLYLNHRVKVRDMRKILNKHHAERGIPLIKSATTLYNRGKAKKKNSSQAKRHIGLGLWCCKKSPKTDGKDNILTHFCRALKKNVLRKFCSGDGDRPLIRSYDDKAYLCPETSKGMESSRSQKVVMSTEPGKGKCLTKYDFPNAFPMLAANALFFDLIDHIL